MHLVTCSPPYASPPSINLDPSVLPLTQSDLEVGVALCHEAVHARHGGPPGAWFGSVPMLMAIAVHETLHDGEGLCTCMVLQILPLPCHVIT